MRTSVIVINAISALVLIYVIWWAINVGRWVYNNMGHSWIVATLVVSAPTSVVIWVLLLLREAVYQLTG